MKGVKKVRSTVYMIEFRIIEKKMMLKKNEIFHKPVIPCDTLYNKIIAFDVTQLYLLWVLSLIILEKPDIFLNM